MNRRSPDLAAADRLELERFKREVNLSEFAAARGYRIDRRESSRTSVVMRHEPTDDKIIVSRAAADQHWTYFYVRDATDNGTIIDFLQRRERAPLGAIRQTLRAWLGAVLGPAPVELADLVASRARRPHLLRGYSSVAPLADHRCLPGTSVPPDDPRAVARHAVARSVYSTPRIVLPVRRAPRAGAGPVLRRGRDDALVRPGVVEPEVLQVRGQALGRGGGEAGAAAHVPPLAGRGRVEVVRPAEDGARGEPRRVVDQRGGGRITGVDVASHRGKRDRLRIATRR
jgi:hypothetical protein